MTMTAKARLRRKVSALENVDPTDMEAQLAAANNVGYETEPESPEGTVNPPADPGTLSVVARPNVVDEAPPALDPRIADILGRIGGQVEELEKRFGKVDRAAAGLKALHGRLEALEQPAEPAEPQTLNELAKLDAQVATRLQGVLSVLDQLDRRVAALEARPACPPAQQQQPAGPTFWEKAKLAGFGLLMGGLAGATQARGWLAEQRAWVAEKAGPVAKIVAAPFVMVYDVAAAGVEIAGNVARGMWEGAKQGATVNSATAEKVGEHAKKVKEVVIVSASLLTLVKVGLLLAAAAAAVRLSFLPQAHAALRETGAWVAVKFLGGWTLLKTWVRMILHRETIRPV